ncbi:hypothetical protein ABZ787_13490 [Micrococcus luteus]|uniref:Uncharacterized protein n=1 Tax=Micrococcus luteus TaxID=1270 RepID=A0AAP3AHK1_MICLU|nr:MULTISPECIES: hypothetical protein [Micrococcus]EZP54555.1 hypothetical protein BW40_01580 [Micrococcus luteus]MCR4487791.1 hypothetical protein [Micrococcus luteus]MCT1858186.1 hypothetical protein [Micrococcus luteus]MCV7510290.1 hypothetical protein [Micrococcus luteus]MCV7528210.1 hypothetical protein [Micrococcus luteus]
MADLIDRAGIELTLAGDPHELLTQLQAAGVRFNDSARTLLFRPALARDLQTSRPVRVVERSLTDLGLPNGGTLPQLRRAALAAGLAPCPPAVAPLLRLRTLDQVNAPDSVLRHGRAPEGSVHVLSPSLGEDPRVHRGFYLRVVDEAPWLRGFMCDDLHVMGADDRWVLSAPTSAP